AHQDDHVSAPRTPPALSFCSTCCRTIYVNTVAVNPKPSESESFWAPSGSGSYFPASLSSRTSGANGDLISGFWLSSQGLMRPSPLTAAVPSGLLQPPVSKSDLIVPATESA